MSDIPHYNQAPRRRAEFIRPPNTLKAKAGSGGLSEEILIKAQALLENNAVDFQPLAELYMTAMQRAIDTARDGLKNGNDEQLISGILYPAMQLKANGGMFHYSLITRFADRMIQFLEVIETLDHDVLDIIDAFHSTMRAIVMGKITGDGGRYGDELIEALNEACMRYFEKSTGAPKPIDYTYLNRNEDVPAEE